MILHFKHKGLKDFHSSGNLSGIQAHHAKKLKIILTYLTHMESLQDLNAPYFDLHPLKGDLEGFWAVKVNKNWRVIFRFDEEQNLVSDIDYLDYH